MLCALRPVRHTPRKYLLPVLYGYGRERGQKAMLRFTVVLLFIVLFVVLCSLWVSEE